jgi:hypothetical protein
MKITLHIALILIIGSVCFANSVPVVSNVTAFQRTDGSGIVDVYYTLSDTDNDRCTVSIAVSDDGGSSWEVPVSPSALEGDLVNVSPGRKHITWDSKIGLPGEYGTNYRAKVTADDEAGPSGMVWIYIDDPGVSGHEGFTGYMSKYETTNAQYCEYLNSAKADGLITVYNNYVYAVSDPCHNEYYFVTYPTDPESLITYSGGVFAARNRESQDMGNHPVVDVSWYGATAFCNYYGYLGYRLPTEWEWQAVADYNESYTYGCGTSIDYSKANYERANPLGLSSSPYTTPVGYYPAYGYGMCDMAGNVFEWTSSCYYSGCSPDSRVIRGGSYFSDMDFCHVTYRLPFGGEAEELGFRVVRDLE